MNQLHLIARQASDLNQQSQQLSDTIQATMNDIVATNASAELDKLIISITIFVLSCFIGYYVVWRVTPTLHTPLMSITNAISGIIIISAMIGAGVSELSLSSVFSYIAVFFAAINIFAGLFVTRRMLKMFNKK
ncbi:MAG: NAD(P) transhydrogenase subunit alpha [Rickettsiaceae bacterium]